MKKYLNNIVGRVFRVSISLVFFALYYTGIVKDKLGLVFVILGGIIILASFVKFCREVYCYITEPKKENESSD